MLISQLSHRCRNHLIVFSIVLLFGFTGCTTFQEGKGTSAEKLYREGTKKFSDKSYSTAIEIFKRILDEFPNSKVRALALMGLASSQFSEGEYEEAKFHFENFIEQYPAHRQVVKAYYLKAMCNFKQMESHERDQTNTHLALEGFEKVISTFPEGKYVERAREKRKICRRQLAMNLLYIGRYYFRVGAYQSVISRVDELLGDYPEQKFLDEAIYLQGESYLREGNREKAYFTFENLIKKFPNSKYKSDANGKLASLKQ